MSLEAVRLECARSLTVSSRRRKSSNDHKSFIQRMPVAIASMALAILALAILAVIFLTR